MLDLKKIVGDAFTITQSVVSDVIETADVTFHLSNGVYDPTSDTYASGTDNAPLVRVLFSKFRENEIDSSIVVETDSKVLLPAVDVDPNVPDTDDYMISQDGRRWTVQKCTVVPGKGLYKLHVRRL